MFHKQEFFCKNCLIHDTFFENGGSWFSDNCPECKDTECIMYKDLTFFQKYRAKKNFNKMRNTLKCY